MEIFEGIDLPEEVVKTLSERIQTEISAVKEGVKNDPEFIDSIRSAEAGKMYGSMESILKRNFDLKDAKLPDDVSGAKKMEAMLKHGLKTLEQSKDSTNQELQDKYLELNAQFEQYKEQEVPKLLEQKDLSYQSRFINDGLLKDALKVESTIKDSFRPAIVNSYLQENGLKKVWDAEKGDYDILNAKDNLKPTKEGKPLSKLDIITSAIEAAGGLVKSNGSSGGSSDLTQRRTTQSTHSPLSDRMTQGMQRD